MDVGEWLSADETAKTLLSRISLERPPLLLPPPLHRLPLRPGNVLEVAGPSSSSKSHILLQVAVNCILPKEWNGLCYGGLELAVMFLDLDCRFDVLRLLQLLKSRISAVNRSTVDGNCNVQGATYQCCCEELITKCLERFLYIRCYDSLEFIATLKSFSYQLRSKKEAYRNARVMMIDSLVAFTVLELIIGLIVPQYPCLWAQTTGKPFLFKA